MASQLHQTLLSLFVFLTIFDIASSMYVAKYRRIPLSAINFREAGLIKKRALDMLDGTDFNMKKRALDALEGTGFGFEKRALDSLDGTGFGFEKRAFEKRALDMLDGTDFSMKKRALDMLDGTGFGMRKRSIDDRYIRISVDELNQLENLKQALRDELRRRRMLVEANQLDQLMK